MPEEEETIEIDGNAHALDSLPPEFRALMDSPEVAAEDASVDPQEPRAEAEAVAVAEEPEAVESEAVEAEAAEPIHPLADYLSKTFNVTPEQFIADMEAQRQAAQDAQRQQEQEQYIQTATARQLDEINQAVESGEITRDMGLQWYANARMAAQAAWDAQQARQELASLRTESELTRIQSEFPGVPIDTLRELAKSNVPASVMRTVAASISQGAEAAKKNAAATYAQTRQAANRAADAHRPITGRAAEVSPSELSWDQIQGMSFDEVLRLGR